MNNKTKFTEVKRSKIIVNRTATSSTYRVVIPKIWAEEGLGLSPTNKDIKVSFNGEQIIIEKF